jgi:hypothetical protein
LPADRSAPIAQPFDAACSASGRAVAVAAGVAPGSTGGGGWAVAMKSTTAPLLAARATDRA